MSATNTKEGGYMDKRDSGAINSTAKKLAKKLAQSMQEKGVITENFKFGRGEDSKIWVSSDAEIITPFFTMVVQDITYYAGVLRPKV